MPPPRELLQLYEDLDLGGLRIRRPSRFIFFCGGAISNDGTPAKSLRHYLLNDRNLGARIEAEIVLAEQANQLYRDPSYNDLISFEEDIARLAAMILLIAESAGSLAELGAFASIDAIRANLVVLIQTDYAQNESFIRYGPIERLKKEDESRIAVYPWSTRKNGQIIKSSIDTHTGSIKKFVNSMIRQLPDEESVSRRQDILPFFMVLWILHLSHAIPITDLYNYALPLTGLQRRDFNNKLYCMKLAGWVSSYPYENKEYWFATSDMDPVSKYSFLPGVTKDTARRKIQVTTAVQRALKVPRHVRSRVAQIKGAPL